MDESTDVSDAALLLVFVRYCADGNIHDNLLFCKELPTRITADKIIRCLDNYFTFKGPRQEELCMCVRRWCCINDWYPLWCCKTDPGKSRNKMDSLLLAQTKLINKADVTRAA